MATYPGGIPALGTVSGADHLTVAQFNTPNDEIEAIATELGVNPTSIDDTVALVNSPASVAAYLDGVANALKTMVGVDEWHKAALPARFGLYGNLQGTTLAPGATIYPYVFGVGSNAAVANTEYILPFAVNIDYTWIDITSAMPSGANDILFVTLQKNGAFLTGGTTYVPPGWLGSFHKQMYSFSPLNVSFAAGDRFSIYVNWNGTASGTSGGLGSWGVEGRQIG